MAELVYAFDLKSNGETRTGSSPVPATTKSASVPDVLFCLGDLDLRFKSRSGYHEECISSRCTFLFGGLGPSVQVPFRLPRRVHQFQMYFFCLGDLDLRCKKEGGVPHIFTAGPALVGYNYITKNEAFAVGTFGAVRMLRYFYFIK